MVSPNLNTGFVQKKYDSALQPVVFYDGECGLCQRSISFIRRQDRNRQFLFAPLQGVTASAILEQFLVRDIQSVVLLNKDQLFLRSDAVLEIAILLGGVWRLVVLLKVVPRPIRDFFYRVIAKVRHRIFPLRACEILNPSEKNRFLP